MAGLKSLPLLLIVSLPVPAAVAHAEDATDKLARQAVEQFIVAYRTSDIKGMMEAVETPWFHNAKEVIQTREQLQREFHKELGRDKDRANLKHIITQVVTYKSVREKLREEERKLADEVIGPEDRVALARLGKEVDGGQGDKVAFLVRIRDGKARVVGIRD